MQIFWTFKFSFGLDILAILGLATVLATFFQNLGCFFQSSSHPGCQLEQTRGLCCKIFTFRKEFVSTDSLQSKLKLTMYDRLV